MTTPTLHAVTINSHVGVGIKARLVKVNQLRARGFSQLAVLYALRHLAAKSFVQEPTLVARARGGFANGRAANYFLDEIAFFIDVNLRFVRRAEQVVIVSHYLLVSAYQHEREIVRLVRVQLMQLEHLLDVVEVNECVDDAVRVARDIAKRGKFGGWLVQ